jgi:hexosaminidase
VNRTLHWDPASVPADCHALLNDLAVEFPLRATATPPPGGLILRLLPQPARSGHEVQRQGDLLTVTFGTLTDLARALGLLLSRDLADGASQAEAMPFRTLGVMVDASRNGVMTVAHFRRWLRRLALLGYNRAMLYTEETYELPGEPYFGYLRGRYTPAELREIDDAAARLGIEMVGCIQTLGHLEQLLKWSSYQRVRDTESVLLVDAPETYALIEKMVKQWASCFRSRTLHVGMDEAHDVGRGRFLDQHGPARAFDLFNRHLGRVLDICRKEGFSPLLWSDMYFRMGSKTGDYYDRASQMPEDVRAAIPSGVELVYWDYYSDSEEHYDYWLRRHRDLGVPTSVASAVWTWYCFWYNRAFTEAAVRPCIDASRRFGVRDLLFTMWADDGAYCEYDSALAGLAYAAERAYHGDAMQESNLRSRFEGACGLPYEDAVTPCGMDFADHNLTSMLETAAFTPPVLWDDPLLRILHKDRALREPGYWHAFVRRMQAVESALPASRPADGLLDLDHAAAMAGLLRLKVDLANRMEEAYRRGDRPALGRLQREIPGVLEALERASETFRRQWLKRYKPNGLEAMQVRFGGLKERYRELDRRLSDYVQGRAANLPEWDEQPDAPAHPLIRWKSLAGAGLL